MNRTLQNAIQIVAIVLSVVLLTSNVSAQDEPQPLKVFVLCGQSNMQGHAKFSSFDHVGMDPETAPMLELMRDEEGTTRVYEHVRVSQSRGPDDGEYVGPLTAGLGARGDVSELGDKVGPEFTFGIYMHQLLGEPILIIKTAWGGKSINTDFRPPSAGPYEFNEKQLENFENRDVDVEAAIKEKAEATGHYYRLMIDHVKHVLSDPGRVHPDYDPQAGFELAGFVWFQGWNDMVDSGTYSNRGEPGGYDQYSQVMAHFIRDVRRDLDAPDMHFVIGVLGVGGPVELYDESQRRYIGIHTNFRNAMAAPASMPEFEGNVTAVLTEECWDKELDDVAQRNGLIGRRAKELREANEGYPDVEGTISPEEQRELVEQFRQETLSERDLELLTGITNAEYHYRGSAKILGLIGKAFAEAMFEGMSE